MLEMMTALTIIHVVVSIALILVVLLQHGKQQGLSGAIAGGAETFFGKNKGRTIDAILKKFTAVVAILFIVSSVTFAAVAINTYNKANEATQTETQATEEGAPIEVSMDENGNMVDAEGNIVMTAEQLAEAEAEQNAAEGEEAPAEATETPAE
ncbi:MAG: preprotein translocase subunit SecG [Clostridia bacterium]|nr:preprotein translocase subunit SecG [Clostridia bacterium]